MMLSRRGLLSGLGALFAAPAVVRASSLMHIRAPALVPSDAGFVDIFASDVNNRLIAFREEITREYIRQNFFSPYAGTELNTIMRVINDIKSGKQTNMRLTARLSEVHHCDWGPGVG